MRNPKQPGDITVVVTKQGVSDAYELNEDPNYAELTVLPTERPRSQLIIVIISLLQESIPTKLLSKNGSFVQ